MPVTLTVVELFPYLMFLVAAALRGGRNEPLSGWDRVAIVSFVVIPLVLTMVASNQHRGDTIQHAKWAQDLCETNKIKHSSTNADCLLVWRAAYAESAREPRAWMAFVGAGWLVFAFWLLVAVFWEAGAWIWRGFKTNGR